MKTTTQKDAYCLPVSKKFYTRLRERITSVFATLGRPSDTLTIDKMMEGIRLYMKGCRELVRTTMPDDTCYVIFLTLCAEIDTAIVRSARARQAAARRRALRLTPPSSTTSHFSDNSDISDNSDNSDRREPSSSSTPSSSSASLREAPSSPSAQYELSELSERSAQPESSELSEMSAQPESSDPFKSPSSSAPSAPLREAPSAQPAPSASSELSDQSELSEMSAQSEKTSPAPLRKFRFGIKAIPARPKKHSRNRTRNRSRR